MKITQGSFIYKPSGEFSWGKTHAQVPFPVRLKKGEIRVFFATRDQQSRSGVSFIDISESNPTDILYIHNDLCFSYGQPGYFDDSGTMPSWFIKEKEKLLLYYTAWNKSESASYRLSIGMAESTDNGLTFTRLFEGPVLDRGPYDPVWVGQPCVLKEECWKMWYLSCQKIEYINNHPEPFYSVKYAESVDGILWNRKEITCIGFDENTDAIGRPFVWRFNGKYYMLHSNRKADGYRESEKDAYRIELSVSGDGLKWTGCNDFHLSKPEEGWNSVMNEYTAAIETEPGKFLVLYNGYGFGASGFGYFILEL